MSNFGAPHAAAAERLDAAPSRGLGKTFAEDVAIRKAMRGYAAPVEADTASRDMMCRPSDYSAESQGGNEGPRTHVARSGDSYAKIARQVYGDERYALALARANGANSTMLQVGSEVQLPDLSSANLREGGAFIAADAQHRAEVAEQRRINSVQESFRRAEILQMNAPGGSAGNEGLASAARFRPGGVTARYETEPAFDTWGNPTGYTTEVLVSDKAPTPYPQAMRQLAAASADLMVIGPAKGIGNLIPETLTTIGKGWAYVGAGLRDGFDALRGAESGNYLQRTLDYLEPMKGEVFEYDSGLQKMGGVAGGIMGPAVIAKGFQLGAKGLSLLQESEVSMLRFGAAAEVAGGSGVGSAAGAADGLPLSNAVLNESRVGWGQKGQGSGNKIDQLPSWPVLDPAGAKIPVHPWQSNGPVAVQEFPGAPLAHGFPNIVDNYAGAANTFGLKNGATLHQIEGSLNGVGGRFEWIVDSNMGGVTHRMFVPSGTINGIPVKP